MLPFNGKQIIHEQDTHTFSCFCDLDPDDLHIRTCPRYSVDVFA